MNKWKVTLTVEVTEHEDGSVDYIIEDDGGELFTRKRGKSTYDAALDIGQCVFELCVKGEPEAPREN